MHQFDLPENALITGDKADPDYRFEDMMLETNLNFLPLRKKNSHNHYRLGWFIFYLAVAKWLKPQTA